MNSNAFASTFYFFSTHNPIAEKNKRSLQATAPDSETSAFKIDTTHLRTDRRASANMGLKEMAGAVVNQTVVLPTNFCGRLTVPASKPPLL